MREGVKIGKYFEELNVGDKWVSQGRAVSAADILIYAGIGGDDEQLLSTVAPSGFKYLVGDLWGMGWLILARTHECDGEGHIIPSFSSLFYIPWRN